MKATIHLFQSAAIQVILMVSVVVLIFSGCGKKTESQEKVETIQTETESLPVLEQNQVPANPWIQNKNSIKEVPPDYSPDDKGQIKEVPDDQQLNKIQL